jgi:hypothetical protein
VSEKDMGENGMNRSLFRLLTVLWFLVLAACGSTDRCSEPSLYPEVHLTIGEEGKTVIRFGVCNIGQAGFVGDSDFAGELCLYDETETLLRLRTVESLGPVAAHETVLPGQLIADLLPGRYHLTYYTETCGFTEADFFVAEQDGVRCLRTPLLLDDSGDLTVTDND